MSAVSRGNNQQAVNGSRPGSSAGVKTPPPGPRTNGGAPMTMSPRNKNKDISSQTQCRNILIYGFCRYQDKGCIFSHDTQPKGVQSPGSSSVTDSAKKKLNVESATFTPGASPSFTPAALSSPPQSKLTSKAVDAAVFTPRMTALGTATPPISTTPLPQINLMDQSMIGQGYMQQDVSGYSNLAPGFENMHLDSTASGASYDYNAAVQPAQINPYAHQTTGDMYYQQQQAYAQPLQYHLYAPLGPHKQNLNPYQRIAHDFFLSDTLREELTKKCEATLQTLPSSTLPNVDVYHSLVPLDLHIPKTQSKQTTGLHQNTFGYTSWVYKAISSKDGNAYVLRRLEGFRLANEKAIRIVEHWKRVLNSNIVTVHDAFTTRAFGDSSIVFVYDYHPLSQTLQEIHFGATARSQNRGMGQPVVSEQVLWAYLIQLTSSMKTIHSSGLAARCIDLTKIILTSKSRIRLNCCSIFDVLQFDAQRSILDLQQEDYVAIGRVILTIASNNLLAMTNPQKSMDYVSRTYTADFKTALLYLFNGPQNGKPRAMDDLIGLLASQMIQNLDSIFHHNDSLESELTKELENGRIVRLLTKLGFINERPEFEHDRGWSETGDRYLLLLFRDYVFHQVDEHGGAVVDLGHVLSCLNKLDAGTDEKVMLISRDEQNCLIVTYKELKRAVESSFQELLKTR